MLLGQEQTQKELHLRCASCNGINKYLGIMDWRVEWDPRSFAVLLISCHSISCAVDPEYLKPVLFLIVGDVVQLFLFWHFPKGLFEK